MRRSNRIPHPSRAALPTLTLASTLAATLMLTLAGPAQAAFWAPESGGSPNADRIHTLYTVVFAVGVVIFVLVFGALVYALVKFRARPGAVAEQLHGNTRLEIGWTAGAAAIVLVLGVVTFALLPGIRNPENSDPAGWPIPASFQTAKDPGLLPPDGKSLNIDVNGQQYAWRFVYPDGDDDRTNNVVAVEEMVVPTGTAITLDVRSSDVGHAWWIPKLGGKVDALPGYTNHTWFKVPLGKEGVYTGQCAELCGRNHANMTARVRAVTPDEFTAWLAQQKADLEAAAQGAEAYRAEQQRQDQEAVPDSADGAATGEAGTSGDAPAPPTTTNPEATADDAASQR
ncbi:MAG: cytochrome c oxidase subunit II [Patulibacter sp.]|nr:cytochrome c oxidase subunit II [Patulibacter sp.]